MKSATTANGAGGLLPYGQTDNRIHKETAIDDRTGAASLPFEVLEVWRARGSGLVGCRELVFGGAVAVAVRVRAGLRLWARPAP